MLMTSGRGCDKWKWERISNNTGCPTIGVPKVNLYKNRIFWAIRLVLSNISY